MMLGFVLHRLGLSSTLRYKRRSINQSTFLMSQQLVVEGKEGGREGGREGGLLPCPCLPAVLRFDYDCASLSRHMYIHRDHFPLSTHCTFQRQLVNSTHATIKNIMSMTHVLLYTDSLNKLKSYSIYFCKIYNHTCRSVH